MMRAIRVTSGLSFIAGIAALAMAGCHHDEQACDPVALTGCTDGTVCEEVEGADPACFAPLFVRGQVFSLADDGAIAGARVVGIDANGSPLGAVAVTDAAGAYDLAVPTRRQADGTPVGADFTLRADAAGFQTFPSGVRQPLPVDSGAAALVDGDLVVQSALTDIGLIPLPAGAGTGIIRGTVEVPVDHAGALVVAEGPTAGTAIADREGDYAIFNLEPGGYTVTAYARGVNYDSASPTLAAGQTLDVDLAINDLQAGTVSGTIQIVNAPGGAKTSVILVVEGTFDERLARGETPPGLRAPDAGLPPDVSGAYTITGVPAGRYVVLAAFENDGLVRDPDLSIGGTSILHVQVTAGQTTTVDGFKVTEALKVLGPGATGPEQVTSAPTLSWKDDSSEDEYEITVFDAFGNEVWTATEPRHTGDNPAVAYGGPLEAGMYYQFRVTSFKSGVPISRTEDLLGVFYR
ncbi:MAG: carboxypeptidase regulatory-like domain-containing protein [Deltaproteobacteria bacterium]|nr:carboxypeptidase regulatory-like domain-containing protein [Deltaproteobacteria bacterium]